MTLRHDFSITVLGAFDLLDAEGRSIRPAGRKDCALLAMLALARRHRQTRSWLQEKLWGDRGPAQAAASLRRSLCVLRALLNEGREAIAADRTWVWLAPDAFRFDHLAPDAAGEVLRGFDLREEGFADWLREARAATEARPAGLLGVAGEDRVERRWHFEPPHHTPGDARAGDAARLLVDGLLAATATIGLRGVVDRRAGPASAPVRITDLVARTEVLAFGDDAVLGVAVTDGYGTRQWGDRREVRLGDWGAVRQAQIELAQAFEDFAIRAEAARLRGARWSAHANGCHALRGLLVPGSISLQEVLACSRAAIEASEHGIYHALVGQAHLFLYGERETPTLLDVDELMESTRTALRLSPGNGLVQALAGHSYGFFAGDLDRNDAMTREAVRLLPTSGPCWIFRAIALTYSDRYAEAVDAAATAVAFSRGTMAHPFARFTQLFARLMAGDVRGAIRAGEEAVDAIPFRPAVMSLMTAYAFANETEKGREKLEILRAREPDLSVEMLRSPSYPIRNSVHRSYVVEASGGLGLH